jgi:8-oxo-dGTP pyrophosphatase MutT (NUDIX family)
MLLLANRQMAKVKKVTKSKKIKAAGGVLFRMKDFHQHPNPTGVPRHIEVVLIERNGLWDIPKGKVEKKEGIAAAAVREVEEEIGVNTLLLTHFITTTEHTYQQKTKEYFKTTYWYGMVLPVYMNSSNHLSFVTKDEFTAQLEEGITRVEWVPLDEAISRVAFDNLKAVLCTFRDQWNLRL